MNCSQCPQLSGTCWHCKGWRSEHPNLPGQGFLQMEELVMQRMCRKIAAPIWRRRQLAMTELLRHARVVTDPNKLDFLTAEVARRKVRAESDVLVVKREVPL
jgi:hypothetical protein